LPIILPTEEPAPAQPASFTKYPRREATIGYWLAIFATISWAIASVLTKAATGKLPPQLLFATELAVGAITLWTWVLYSEPFRISIRTACKLALPGLLQPGLAFSITFVALQWTTISNETLIWSTESILMLLLAAIFFGQRLTRPIVLLSLAAFAGVALMSLARRQDPAQSHRIVLANIMIVLAVLAACAYTFLAERALVQLHEEQLFALHQTAGLAVAAIFAIIESKLSHHAPAHATWQIWAIACIAGILLFAVPFVLYLRAIRILGSSAAAQFLPLVPVLTAGLAAIFLRESLNATQCLGIAIVIAAVTTIGWLQKNAADRQHRHPTP
jgi:probable blue pigment (indigoidine) exporter